MKLNLNSIRGPFGPESNAQQTDPRTDEIISRQERTLTLTKNELN